ncbi:MAG: peptidyl-prolyl cis-trans isomerase [Betaproteobacteria bacterium]|nr:peptidyl-prolyl cis-trans isomerase [Betaproteobacteria bacterium]
MTRVRLLTNYGVMVLELEDEKAPQTVANFLQYVRDGFYDGTLFHRAIPDFMIQGGGLERGMHEKPAGAPVENEAANGLKNKKWTVAMARLPAPHSATSQFFINIADNDFLDFSAPTEEGFGYCVFGRVAEGEEIAAGIGEVKTGGRSGHKDVPEQDVVIESAAVENGA